MRRTYWIVDVSRTLRYEAAHVVPACLAGRRVEDPVLLLLTSHLDVPDGEDWTCQLA